MGPIASRSTTDAPPVRLRAVARTLALLGTTAALGLVASGCGSGHDGHAGPAAGGTTTAASTEAANAVDRAFVAQMIPHHRMAVQMAADTEDRAEHAEIRTLGADITRTQDAEIAAMQAVAKQLGVTPAAAPSGGMAMDHGAHASGSMASDAQTLGLPMDAMGMSMDMDALRTARPFDRAFIDEMLPHHQGAIRMARAELARGTNPELRRIATAVVAAQKTEIERMNAWRKAWYGAASPKGGVPAA